MNVTSVWRNAPIRAALVLLEKRDRFKLKLLVTTQIILSFVDLLGVALIGLLSTLAVSGVQSESPGNKTHRILEIFRIADYSFQTQVAILGVFSGLLLVGKSLVSVYLIKYSSRFLARKGASLANNLTSRIFSESLTSMQRHSAQEYIYGVGYGISSIMLGIIATSLAVAADLSLLIVISFGLFLIQPTIAISSLAFFGLLGIILNWFMGKRARELGKKNRQLSVSSDELLVTSVDSYRYLTVSNRMSYLLRKLSSLRIELADVSAEIQILPNISKYIFESSVIIGALLISCFQFIILDANHAVASLAVFLAAASRLAPAALRIQQGAITIRNSLGSADLSYQLINELKDVSFQNSHENPLNPNHKDFKPIVKLDNLSFKYPNVSAQVFDSINCSVTEGQFVAIIGPSGSGKTTLVDLILGLLEPDTGRIQISGISPKDATQRWPGAIAYVPQKIELLNGTLKENICLGYEASEIENQHLSNVLEMVQLASLVQSFPNGIDTNVGDRGLQLSGGQKQRLGIARALLSNPALLILDEATSSLDTQTEIDINESISKLKGKTTIIAIAHRLSTLKSADKIIYVGKNVFLEADSFEAIKNQVSDSQNFLIDL